MLSEMPHRPRHVPVGGQYLDDDHLHEGHVWDCRACVRTNPSLDFGVRGCSKCTHRSWMPEADDGESIRSKNEERVRSDEPIG